MNINHRLMAAGLLAAFGGGMGLGSFSDKAFAPARDICAQCGCKIHPGRPGRKCKPCREAKPIQNTTATVETDKGILIVVLDSKPEQRITAADNKMHAG